jgi:serine/threonine protein kinase
MRDVVPIRVQLGGFELDLRAGELRHGRSKVRLQDQPFKVLSMLLENPGEVVTQEEIKKKLWPNDTVVEFSQGIHNAIKRLRQALGDSADEPRYVETVGRRGYRLIVPVVCLESSSGDALSAESSGSCGTSVRLQPETSDLTGKQISHYRVLGIIGGGGMGLVYKAEDLKLGRRVALKFLPEELASDPLALQRFEREARTASSLNHPNICSIYEFGEHEGQSFIAMELLDGETLRDRLAAAADDNRRIPLEDLLHIAVQVAGGLEAAHEQGIIHRDIKPANIFLTRKGTAKILDFGLAKVAAGGEQAQAPPAVILSDEVPQGGTEESKDKNLDGIGLPRLALSRSAPSRSLGMTHENDGAAEAAPFPPATPVEQTLTRTGVAMGTAGYMSPEQVRAEKLDARTDLFSFGLVLYEMASGQRAFTGETAAILKDAILNNTPARVRELNATIPAKLEQVIAKAIEKDRARRYQSADDMRVDLETVSLERQPTVTKSRVRRHWKLLATSLVALAVGVTAVFYSRSSRATKLAANDSIVLADFNNSTGDDVFDGSLKQALAIHLEQSPFLNMLSERKVNAMLKQMNRAPNERLTPELAREVCQRTNSKALLAGSIGDLGERYRIELRAVDCATGKVMGRTEAETVQ